MSNLVNKLVSSLAQDLRSDGFSKHSPCVLMKQRHDHSDLILFGSRKDTASGIELCSFNVGISFPLVEALLNPDEEAALRPTIGSPVHLLTKERTFQEWSLDPLSLEAVQTKVRVWIDQFAAPFFEAFQTLDAIVERLSHEDASNWFSMTPVRRAEILAASLFVLHRKSEAVGLLESEIERNREKPPKYRVPLQRLLQNLMNSDSPPTPRG